MIINKLKIENFGVFKGINEFTLKPPESSHFDKSIILFGGKNGAGKSTILESVKLCLYGQWINGRKMRAQDYKDYINKKIHQPLNSPEKSEHTSITLEFEYGQLGEAHLFKVVRSWTKKHADYKEKLEVYRDGVLLKDVDPDQWQEFINELIPLGVSQLFFFDGEKIQELAEEQENNYFLLDSFKALLGLNLVEKLQSDLNILVRRKLKSNIPPNIVKLIKEQEEAIKDLNYKLDSLNQERAQINTNLAYIDKNIVYQEQKIASEGGSYAAKRDKYKALVKESEYKINVIEENIRELASGLFPFAITPKYCKKLKKRLKEEEELYNIEASKKIILEKLEEIESKLKDYKLKKLLRDSFSPIIHSNNGKIIHQLSPFDRNKLLDAIEKATRYIPFWAEKEFKDLEKYAKLRHEAQLKLDKIPSDEILKPLIEENYKLNQKKGKLLEQLKNIDKRIKKTEYKETEAERKYKNLFERIKSDEKTSRHIELIDKVQDVLKEYDEELKKLKIMGLQNKFIETFRGINRKSNFVHHVNIAPKNFQIKLYTPSGRELSKDQLSAGEKQLFAISMLWALIKISNRNLPLIIDTPLGRLDGEHRENIVINFFPQVSHQTILLSTDTEIDKHYFDKLKPYIAFSYHLEYNSDEGYTKVNDGYFWKHESPTKVVL